MLLSLINETRKSMRLANTPRSFVGDVPPCSFSNPEQNMEFYIIFFSDLASKILVLDLLTRKIHKNFQTG